MAFPDTFLDELTARTDIVDLISRYVVLRRRGGSMVGLCPFHGEKTPSFTVSPDKQVYHCFGCGAGGGAIQFTMQIENLDFSDAVRLLAERAGMQTPERSESPADRQLRERLYELHAQAARFYHHTLVTGINPYAAEYLTRRGFTAKTVRRFGLGVCAPGATALVEAMTELGFTKNELIAGNLAVAGDRGDVIDRFRNRVMFPIINVRKQVIAFGGRIMDAPAPHDRESRQAMTGPDNAPYGGGGGRASAPKYLNSSDTPIFSKSRNLFALNFAKSSAQKTLILAEGYMDVIALHQAGFDNAVASLGTSLTETQAQLIRRYTGEVIIAYDSDNAGRSASERAAQLLGKADVKVSVLSLDGAKDPDEFIKTYGAGALRLRLERRESHVAYSLAQKAAGVDMDSDEGRVEFLKEAAKLLAAITSEVERDVFTSRAAEMAGVAKEAVALEVKKLRGAAYKKAGRKEARDDIRVGTGESRVLRAEAEFIKTAIGDPELAKAVAAELKPSDFETEFLGKIWEKILSGTQSYNSLSQYLTEEQERYLSKVITQPVSAANVEQALLDSSRIILDESGIRASDDPVMARMALAAKKKKRYGEEA